MTTLSLPQIGRDTLTHSRIACARTCQRKEWFRYEIGITPDRTAKPLRMGSAVHDGLDLWRRGVDQGDAIFQATQGYAELPAWARDDEARDEWLTEAETVRRLLAGYYWRWADHFLETVASEETFIQSIVNPESNQPARILNVAGKIDGVVKLNDGRLAVLETKTVGQDISAESDYWKQKRMDAQISLYVLAARRAGHNVTAVLYDAIRKPTIKPRKLTKAEQSMVVNDGHWCGEDVGKQAVERETPVMFGARLNADIAERPDFYFQRIEIARLESDLTEFERELWDEQQALQARRKRGIWPRNTSACLTFGRCQYLDLCTAGWTPEQGMPSGFVITDQVHPELVNGENE